MANTYREVRAWQRAREFKLAIYRLVKTGVFSGEDNLRKQVSEAAASAPSQVAEGFGRFEPIDNARFVRNGRASLLECQNHLQDAVDRGLIDEATQQELEAMIQAALSEIGGWLDYLQSDEAKQNAERVKKQRAERARLRRAARRAESRPGKPER
ncbi:MAG TPA: four helix bundle protein [Vicinamibacterales bacterium]|nr:four helix bundle protein [Vicinamibacterales bacterium]